MNYRDRYVLAIAITIAFPLIEGSLALFYTHSHSLLGSALHMIFHAIPLVTGYWSLRMHLSWKRKTELEKFTTRFNIWLLWGLAVVIVGRGVFRFFEPVPILWDETMILAVVEIAANFYLVYLMRGLEHAHVHAHTAHGQMQCFRQDAWAGGGVLVGGIVGKTFDFVHADLLASLIVLWVTFRYARDLSRDFRHHHSHTGHHH